MDDTAKALAEAKVQLETALALWEDKASASAVHRHARKSRDSLLTALARLESHMLD